MAITIVLVFVGFGAAIISLFKYQIVQGEELKSMALDQSLTNTPLTANRGTIYDVTGKKILAQTASVWTVVLEPAYIEEEDREIIADGLSVILDMDKEVILQKASDKSSYFKYLKRRVETEVQKEILAFLQEKEIYSGVRLIDDYKRYYPYGTVASVVLGYTGTDNNGLEGLELKYDNELRGTAGRMINAKNALGTDMPFQYEQLVEAEDGYDLILTIDETVQSILEKYLAQGIDQYVVENGAVAIMMDVKTGAILGLANKGDYDPNDPFTIYDEEVRKEIDALPEAEQEEAYLAAVRKQWRNKAVSDTYYPGSVFKMCVGSMGLEEGVIDVDTQFYCDGVADVEGVSKGISCWKHGGHGSQTFVDGLCNSCNPYFIHIGQKLGPEAFFKYFEAFGFTERTGIDLQGEAGSLYHPLENLNPAELATESMGQNFGITPVQMITAVCAVANGGYLVQPHLVGRIVDSSGNIIKTADTSYKRQVISEETSKTMSEILQRNTDSGTAQGGYVAGYRISGKTGTSEKIAKHNEDLLTDPNAPMQYIASYCGYAPAEDPQYALLVFFDEPQKERNGGQSGGNAVAGPMFSAIMKEVLPYLGVKTQYTDEEFESLDTIAPNVTAVSLKEAYNTLVAAGLSYEVIGDDSNEDNLVTMQIPQVGQPVPKEGKVILYTSGHEEEGDTQVPDFKGCSLVDAHNLAAEYGLQISAGGSAATSGGTVTQQSKEPGATVKRGTVITIVFTDNVITETFTN